MIDTFAILSQAANNDSRDILCDTFHAHETFHTDVSLPQKRNIAFEGKTIFFQWTVQSLDPLQGPLWRRRSLSARAGMHNDQDTCMLPGDPAARGPPGSGDETYHMARFGTHDFPKQPRLRFHLLSNKGVPAQTNDVHSKLGVKTVPQIIVGPPPPPHTQTQTWRHMQTHTRHIETQQNTQIHRCTLLLWDCRQRVLCRSQNRQPKVLSRHLTRLFNVTLWQDMFQNVIKHPMLKLKRYGAKICQVCVETTMFWMAPRGPSPRHYELQIYTPMGAYMCI
jgi:hypothetical protein